MADPATATGLKVETLTCLRGERVLFDPVSFFLTPGEGVFVRGANGAGKSSLLRLLAGLLRPHGGVIAYDGAAIQDDLQAYRRHIAYLGHLDGLKPGETAGEAVGFRKLMSSRTKVRDPSPTLASASPAGDGFRAFARNDDFLESCLTLLNMQPYAATPIRYLSAGQRRRVALAGVLASGAQLWLLDEPTTALDAEASTLVYQALGRHLAAGGMFVAATHDDPPVIAGVATVTLA